MEDATLAQPASGHLLLHSLNGADTFTVASEMLVGREVECDVPLNSGHVSRYHSKISVTPAGVFIGDLKSTNGTFVNGTRINHRTRISAPDSDNDAGESTRLLSATHLNRLADRGQQAQRNIKIGSGPRLILITAPLRGKVFSLENAPMGTHWAIGRDHTSDICINDSTMSAHHAKLSKIPNGYLLTALEAKNSVMVNGQSQTRMFLSHNDRIQMGRVELIFKDDEGNKDDQLAGDELLNQQLKRTRRLVISALATLSALVVYHLV